MLTQTLVGLSVASFFSAVTASVALSSADNYYSLKKTIDRQHEKNMKAAGFGQGGVFVYGYDGTTHTKWGEEDSLTNKFHTLFGGTLGIYQSFEYKSPETGERIHCVFSTTTQTGFKSQRKDNNLVFAQDCQPVPS